MQYVNFVYDNDDSPTLYTAPVAGSDAAYLKQASVHLKPLSDEEYITGPAVILQTAAPYSYVLDGRVLFWCVEWEPGLLIVKIAADTEMSWVALRSPVPNFGGREPLPQDGEPDDYDEDEENPQYNLIFNPWDAQFDQQHREWGNFSPAVADVQSRFENALSRVNKLGSVIDSRYADETDRWLELCQQNLERWCGEGVRLKTAG